MDTEYAWAAGFMDGEGTVTLKRYKSAFTTHKIHYQPYVSLSQAKNDYHFDGVRKMKELFGGSLSEYDGKPPRLPTLQWTCVARDAIKCLEKIRPYLQIKGKHADLLLSYYENAGKKGESYRLTDAELARREEIWSQIRLMNQKGALRLQRLSEEGFL